MSNEGRATEVGFEVDGSVAVITLRRPAVRNAVNEAIAGGLEDAIDRVEFTPEIRAAVLQAEGSVFCSGADLALISSGRRHDMYTTRGGFAGITSRARTKPLIAAVDGPAVAGGFEIVLACDMVVASSDASFGLPEVKRSLIAAGGGLFRASRALPANVAMTMVLTGEPISAQRGFDLGMISELCGAGTAGECARSLAHRIANNAPLAVQASRRLLLEASSADEESLWADSRAAMDWVLTTEDAKEGPRAFLEKREPRWVAR